MITGCDGEEDIRQAFDAGAIDYLVKPVNWDLLKFRIPKWLGSTSGVSHAQLKFRGQPIEMMVTGRGNIVDVSSHGQLETGSRLDRIEDFLADSVAARIKVLLRSVLRVREPRQETFNTEIAGQITNWLVQLDARGRDKVSISIYEDADDGDNRSHLFRLAYIDSATGLPNRHMFMQTLKAQLDRVRFQQRGLTIICFATGAESASKTQSIPSRRKTGDPGSGYRFRMEPGSPDSPVCVA